MVSPTIDVIIKKKVIFVYWHGDPFQGNRITFWHQVSLGSLQRLLPRLVSTGCCGYNYIYITVAFKLLYTNHTVLVAAQAYHIN